MHLIAFTRNKLGLSSASAFEFEFLVCCAKPTVHGRFPSRASLNDPSTHFI